MTQTNDPPTVLDIGLIPNSNEKADLNAPSDSGGKLVVGQAPNITITETTVVADAAERLALDVQEGDIAIQTNVSTSFIFTGGDNVANNWQTLDFDAVGAIDGENIDPSGISGANINSASAGQLLESDGNGQLQFSSPAGGFAPSGPYNILSSSSGTYSNPESVPIFVVASFNIRIPDMRVEVDGVLIATTGSSSSDGERANCSFIVPNGSNYKLQGSVLRHSYIALG